ncbi:MAG: WxL domain-containing protein, partial [Streptococcaceae bacterium]|nr:WxL domain-containing protein [Streptococcaceae bacterium]
KATRGGAILMRSRESKIKIGHGAALEIYQTGANGQVLGAYNQATIIAMNAGATIDVEDYGRFSLFADKMEDGFSPIYFYGNAQINIGKNGIFDLVADTSNSLMHTRGAANQSASINFSDAYRVNIHRFGDKNKYTTRSLFSHQQANGDTVINATSQQLFQWDNGYDSMLEGINIEKQDTLLPEFHEEAIPTGQSFVTNLTFTQNDEGYSRAFAPVYSIRSTFKGTNSNAVNTNIRTFKASDKQNLERQFGRSSFAFDNNTATTNGSKPNRILYGKVFDLEVQLFSTLTDNNTKQQAIYDGSVTQSYLKQGEDGFITDDKGNYIPFDPSENPQAQLIQYDPRKEIIGRVGSTIEKMSYNPITKKMEQKTVFIPLEQAYVKLLANGSVNPLTNAFVDKYNGKNKPQATQTIPTIDLTPEALEGSNFSDLKYSVLSSNENGITIPSSGQTVSGKGYFLYELDKDSDLVAQDLIKVMAYLDGKEFTYGIKAHLQSLKVFDETSPQAQPKNGAKDKDTALAINISQEIELPSPSYFVEKVNDSNPYSNLDGFFSYQYDFTPPVSPIESTTPITSEEMFKEFLGSYDIDEQTKYSIGIRVSDYAGNIIRVDTVVFRITKAQIQPQLSDLYIYKSDLQKYKMTQNEQLMKNWLVQQGIKSINYQVKDDKNNLLIEKDYEPSKKFDTKTHLFKVENMDGLFNNQEIGKIYQIEAILLAKKANPTLKPDKGITSDYPVQFKIMVIDDTLSINATKPLNFGNHLISAQTRQENYELTENTQLIEIQDSVGKYDTKDGKLTDEELEINDKGEKEIIRTGKIKDISSIKKTPNKQALQTWKVTAELSKPFQTSQGKLLNASIEFEQGNLISASDTENFEVKKSIFYNGSSIVLVDGNLGGNYLFTKGKNQIDFAKDQVTLHVPLAEKKLGDFTGELTYTLISSPNK